MSVSIEWLKNYFSEHTRVSILFRFKTINEFAKTLTQLINKNAVLDSKD